MMKRIITKIQTRVYEPLKFISGFYMGFVVSFYMTKRALSDIINYKKRIPIDDSRDFQRARLFLEEALNELKNP